MSATNPSDVDRKRGALAIAGLIFGLCAPAIYVLVRLYEAARGEWVDPASILRQVHAAYTFRALMAIWFAAFVAALARRWLAEKEIDLEVLARRIARLALFVVAGCSLAAWLVP
jgi:hypothetical protein